ncbi:MAG: hypothetical protein LBU92_04680 [Prevotellaceae bacterium]|jgi:predicted transcriptional regulator|nr:hypothetical protein [Prevotellaceae bacterium]
MTVVSSKEFATHQRKYFGMAMDSEVCIKRGRNMFRLMHQPAEDEQPILEPDEDLRNAISMEELRESVHEFIHKLYAGK